jgi:hypothetical protein
MMYIRGAHDLLDVLPAILLVAAHNSSDKDENTVAMQAARSLNFPVKASDALVDFSLNGTLGEANEVDPIVWTKIRSSLDGVAG